MHPSPARADSVLTGAISREASDESFGGKPSNLARLRQSDSQLTSENERSNTSNSSQGPPEEKRGENQDGDSSDVLIAQGASISINRTMVRSWSKPSIKHPLMLTQFTHGVCSLKGPRKTMEDAHKAIPNMEEFFVKEAKDTEKQQFLQKEQSLHRGCHGLYLVCDGHGGERCSEFIADSLPRLLFLHQDFPQDINKSFTETFLKVEADWFQYAEEHELDGGSTVIAALFIDDRLIVANVGDSEGVLCRKHGRAVLVSKPHNMKKNPSEMKRVKQMGGRIHRQRIGHPLYNPSFFSIGVSRAMGDAMYKNERWTQGHPSGLICHPEIREIRMRRSDKFLILACDGLWDVISYQGAIDFVLARTSAVTTTVDWDAIAKDLCEHALSKGSSDNVTVLVISFTKTCDALFAPLSTPEEAPLVSPEELSESDLSDEDDIVSSYDAASIIEISDKVPSPLASPPSSSRVSLVSSSGSPTAKLVPKIVHFSTASRDLKVEMVGDSPPSNSRTHSRAQSNVECSSSVAGKDTETVAEGEGGDGEGDSDMLAYLFSAPSDPPPA